LGQAFAVFQAFSLAKLRILRLRLYQKLKFWESLNRKILFPQAAILILKNMVKWRNGRGNHKAAAWQFAGSGG
jgi:hypothetical protein